MHCLLGYVRGCHKSGCNCTCNCNYTGLSIIHDRWDHRIGSWSVAWWWTSQNSRPWIIVVEPAGKQNTCIVAGESTRRDWLLWPTTYLLYSAAIPWRPSPWWKQGLKFTWMQNKNKGKRRKRDNQQPTKKSICLCVPLYFVPNLSVQSRTIVGQWQNCRAGAREGGGCLAEMAECRKSPGCQAEINYIDREHISQDLRISVRPEMMEHTAP